MTPTAPGKHNHIGMPKSTNAREIRDTQCAEDDRKFAPREQALEFATALANRNAELMRRLA